MGTLIPWDLAAEVPLIRSDVFGPGLHRLLCSAKALPGNRAGSRL